ncbi:MAG: hypothetical protein SLAVMIC_00886 [uncultured marine phage]|uniref:Uncharacterized protein n=1 Tax=uncultured marine phage TaxID=707152 RepID=A0A8D9CCW1_9VIRU|nr:MAG: hypothetical protein SLAVMIC_00886 [uncultured marine phage]
MLVIGNKPYKEFNMNPIIDSFESNTRCNMSLPNKNNGTKCDEWALCAHLYDNTFRRKLTIEKYKVFYKVYNESEIDIFWEKLDEYVPKYSKIYLGENRNRSAQYNGYLNSIGCPYKFTKIARTGYVVVMESLLSKKEVDIIGFSIHDEIRKSYYVKEGFYESDCHSKGDEVSIIKWLHNKGIVDATLCLIEDCKEPTLNCSELIPTIKSIDKFLDLYGKCILINYDIREMDHLRKYKFEIDGHTVTIGKQL